MKVANKWGWSMLVGANVLCWFMLGFYRDLAAAPGEDTLPFANAVAQRAEMIKNLKDINEQLKLQNELFRSGKLQVVVSEKRPGK